MVFINKKGYLERSLHLRSLERSYLYPKEFKKDPTIQPDIWKIKEHMSIGRVTLNNVHFNKQDIGRKVRFKIKFLD